MYGPRAKCPRLKTGGASVDEIKQRQLTAADLRLRIGGLMNNKSHAEKVLVVDDFCRGAEVRHDIEEYVRETEP